MNDLKYKKLLNLARKEYQQLNMHSHDWDHIQRVLQYCERINKKEKTDVTILFPACILHDLGRVKGKEKDHSTSIEKSDNLLAQSGYAEDERKKIIDCILSHSVNSDKKPVSMEAKILFDADKLDSYGAIGVTRFFTLAGEQQWNLQESIDHAFERITKLSSIGGFYTKEAEQIGTSKAKTTFIFYYFLFQELNEMEKIKSLEKIFMGKYGKIKGKIILKTLKKYF